MQERGVSLAWQSVKWPLVEWRKGAAAKQKRKAWKEGERLEGGGAHRFRLVLARHARSSQSPPLTRGEYHGRSPTQPEDPRLPAKVPPLSASQRNTPVVMPGAVAAVYTHAQLRARARHSPRAGGQAATNEGWLRSSTLRCPRRREAHSSRDCSRMLVPPFGSFEAFWARPTCLRLTQLINDY